MKTDTDSKITWEQLLENSRNAEAALLGLYIRYAEAFSQCVSIVSLDDFSSIPHRCCYQACHGLFNDGVLMEMPSVAQWLQKNGKIADVGLPYLAKLFDSAPTGEAWLYAENVRAYSIRRQLHLLAREVQDDVLSQSGASADELIAAAIKRFCDVFEANRSRDVISIGEAVAEARDEYDLRHQRKNVGLATGFVDLDLKTAGGLHPGELWLVAARTSVGKTSMALNIAKHVAANGNGVLICSLEQSGRELADRMICSLSGTSFESWRQANLEPEAFERARIGWERVAGLPIHIDDFPGQGLIRITANIRRMKMQRDSKLLIVDYLQLIEPERGNSKQHRHEQVSEISRRLKNLARELGIPVIALAQLNRSAEDRDEPQISHLRESGSLEQDADVIALLYRAEPETSPNQVTVKIGKNRNGPLGRIILMFDGSTTTFRNHAPDFPNFR